MTPGLRYNVLTANLHSKAIKLPLVPDWFNCLVFFFFMSRVRL